ncbi:MULTISPECIES: c-type cytochrome [unclassified Mesorhizobium]|uniref:c-type cytochrome n=1 Tax=unclassified Mesorhizobium TaxID=325217 RepID=UPI00333B81EE
MQIAVHADGRLDYALLDDAELYWIMQNGIKMTGMPAFGSTHNQEELWAMVAFTRRLPEMSQSEYEKITEASEGHHQAGGEDRAPAAFRK